MQIICKCQANHTVLQKGTKSEFGLNDRQGQGRETKSLEAREQALSHLKMYDFETLLMKNDVLDLIRKTWRNRHYFLMSTMYILNCLYQFSFKKL